MASSNGPKWLWSAPHNNYYCYAPNANGEMICHWASSTQQAPSYDATPRPRVDSGGNVGAAMPDPVPHDIRSQFPDFISGTPGIGWYEPLDPSYRVRTGAEAYSFFRPGKVFSMLHTQAANVTAPTSDSFTVVKYGEHAFSQIRRFVIVEVRHGFVKACPITTYSGRATLKPGCIAKEHSVVHLRQQQPTLLPGEYLEKEPICVVPVDASTRFDPASRIHYSKTWPVEMNVKVKDIGDVDPQDMANLLRYYREEN